MPVQYMLNLQTFFTDQSVVCLCSTISQVLESRIRPTMQNSTHLRHTPRLHILLCNWKMNPLQKTAKVKLQAMGCLENSGMLSHPHRIGGAEIIKHCWVAKLSCGKMAKVLGKTDLGWWGELPANMQTWHDRPFLRILEGKGAAGMRYHQIESGFWLNARLHLHAKCPIFSLLLP